MEYWLLDAYLSRPEGGSFTARFYGKGEKKQELRNEEEVNDVIEATSGAAFTVTVVALPP